MPPAVVAGAGIVSNIIGGIAGKDAGQGDRDSGKAAATEAYQQLANMGMPPDEAKAIIMQQFQQAGILTPELEAHIDQGPSQMADITTDPALKDSQMNALKILSQRGKGGLTPEDRAALNKVRGEIATDTEAKRQQIMQNFQARGQAGGGAELIAALQASQSGANNESEQGDRLAATASQNALQAIGQAGTLGGQMRSQDFGEQSDKAKAQDVINQFNTQNQVGQQARNVAAGNTAQASNLQNKQNIQNTNTQQANQELLRQRDAQRQEYLDKLNRATTISNAATGYNTQMQAAGKSAADAAAAPWTGVGSSLITAVTPDKDGNTILNSLKKYNGGEIPHYDDGGDVKPDPSLADKLRNYFDSKPVQQQRVDPSAAQQVSNSFKSVFAEGGQVKTPTEIAQESMRKAFHFSDGGGVHQPDEHQRRMPVTDFRQGGHVPGRANVPGDSPENDTIPAMVSPGEFVIPRTTAKSQFGKKLIKLLEQHHEVMKHAPKDEE